MLGKLYGQEKNLTTSAIARMNLFLHGAEDFHIERGDTLCLPVFYSGDSLATLRWRCRARRRNATIKRLKSPRRSVQSARYPEKKRVVVKK